jgi:RNA polymerase sigma-70 factor (ECF subfamily)
MDPHKKVDEPSAFEKGVVASYPRLFALAIQLCRNPTDAQDLVQDAVERGLRCRTLFRTGDAPDRWITTILRRIFVDDYRSRRSRIAREALEASREPATLPPERDDPSPWERFSVEDVERALLFVDPASRETFSQFTFGNLGQTEIAQRLSISRQTVATRVFRTRERLRKLLTSGAYQRPLALVPPPAGGAVAKSSAANAAGARAARALSSKRASASPKRPAGATG